MAAKRGRFDAKDFLVRWVVAMVLVLGTYNPTAYSYFHWVTESLDTMIPYKVVAGLALLILFVIYLRATWRSIGPIGIGIVLAFFAAIVWLLYDIGIFKPDQATEIVWTVLVIGATIIAIGVSWSHIRRRITGQLDMDEVGE